MNTSSGFVRINIRTIGKGDTMAADPTQPSVGVPDRDIIFDCPHCGRSLGISERGAGLMVTCPDCQRDVQVPGMPLAARVADSEEVEEVAAEVLAADPHMRVEALTEALASSQAKVQRLVESLEEIRERRRYLEKLRSDNMARFEQIGKELVVVQNAFDRIVGLLQDAKAETLSDEI